MPQFNQTRSFNLGIAAETSVEAALIYDDLAYFQNQVGTDGWVYRSYETMLIRLPVYSEKTLRRHVQKLVDAGWVRTKVMKIEGVPTCHYQIVRSLSDNLTVSMEKDKLTVSINNNSNTSQNTKKSETIDNLLSSLLSLVNPKEKATADRRRALNARLKDYTVEEITEAAVAFSKSVWHRENHQMSIDNLLAPSKFGRWYAQRNKAVSEERDPDAEDDMTMEERRAALKKRMG